MSNVPAGATILLDFIGETETGRTGNDAYRTIYRHKQATLPKPVTDVTLDELLAAQPKLHAGGEHCQDHEDRKQAGDVGEIQAENLRAAAATLFSE